MSSKTTKLREIQGRLLNAITLLSALPVQGTDEPFLRRILGSLRDCEDDLDTWVGKPLSIAERILLNGKVVPELMDPALLRGMLEAFAATMASRRLLNSEAKLRGISCDWKDIDGDESVLFIPILRCRDEHSISMPDITTQKSTRLNVRVSGSLSEVAQGLLPESDYGKVRVLVGKGVTLEDQDQIAKLILACELMLELEADEFLTFRPIIDAELLEDEE